MWQRIREWFTRVNHWLTRVGLWLKRHNADVAHAAMEGFFAALFAALVGAVAQAIW